jgi:nucleotide-binding universal stress UspA family protein
VIKGAILKHHDHDVVELLQIRDSRVFTSADLHAPSVVGLAGQPRVAPLQVRDRAAPTRSYASPAVCEAHGVRAPLSDRPGRRTLSGPKHHELEVAMFTRVLCATDGSDHGDRALRYSAELACRERAELHVVHVIEKLWGGGMSGQNVLPNEAEIDDRIRAQTEAVVHSHELTAIVHLPKTNGRGVPERLARIADQVDADLIVVGTRGRSPIAGLISGSVTQRLLHTTARPVLAVPPDDRAPETSMRDSPPVAVA